MALAALIIAMREAAAEPAHPHGQGRHALVATLPFLGRTLIEHQVSQARAAGADHVVVLIERMPAALLAALDRLRRDGIALDVARVAADAADRFHPDEQVVLIGDGVIASQPLIDRLASSPAPALAVTQQAGGFERLDASGWWAGLALVDGATVRETAALPGEWDAESTLVRRAVQGGALRIDAGPAAEHPLRATDAAELRGVAARLTRAKLDPQRRWVKRWLIAPLAGAAVRVLAGRRIEAAWFALAATVIAIAGGTAALAGSVAVGYGLLLLSGPLVAIAERLAAVRLEAVPRRRLAQGLRAAGAALVLIGVGLVQGAWGWTLLAATTLLILLALGREEAMLARHGGNPPGWSADPDSLAWSTLPVALIGGWSWALVFAGLVAAASFVAVQDRLARTSAV